MTVRPMTEAERMYSYTQSQQIRNQAGNIGYLRADMDTDGEGFFSSWFGFRDDWKTQAFRVEFDSVIAELRTGEGPEAFLRDRKTLTKYCFAHPEAALSDREFGFRCDTRDHAYLMRVNPARGEYSLYCYCYRREWLDRHLKEAEKGIRIIDSGYRELFRIPDGARIRITFPGGERREEVCRYIDPYHMEIGLGSTEIFHICEFAEQMEHSRAKVEPVPAGTEKAHAARSAGGAR